MGWNGPSETHRLHSTAYLDHLEHAHDEKNYVYVIDARGAVCCLSVDRLSKHIERRWYVLEPHAKIVSASVKTVWRPLMLFLL